MIADKMGVMFKVIKPRKKDMTCVLLVCKMFLKTLELLSIKVNSMEN